MSREVFEYFFESDELEPHYSRLPKVAFSASNRQVVVENSIDLKEEQTQPNATDGDWANHELIARDFPLDRESALPESSESVAESEAIPQPTESDNSEAHVPSAPQKSASSVQSDSVKKPHRVRQLLSVHALGQYVFCVRSAILAAERGDDQDVDEPLPRLTYLPNFDRERIEEMLSENLRTVGVSLLYFVSLLLLMVIGVISQNRKMFYTAMFVSAGYLVWLAMQCLTIFQLIARRRAALNAEANEPPPDFDGTQDANWWSMLKAGFEPINYQRPFRHPELPLEGCPWRVLERGCLRIPVIRTGGKRLGALPGKLFEKHEVRLAAYAMLLESAQQVEVPYGLIFPARSPKGLALEITDELRSKARRMLNELRLKLRESQQEKIEPRLPVERGRCEQCRYGKPEPIELTDIESRRRAGAQIVVLRSEKGGFFHCACADRFGSAPPHRDVNRLELLAIIE